MDNSILEALAKVPELVEMTQTIIRQNEKTNAIFGKVLEQRAQAVIPHEEVEKVVRSVAETVQHTRCATPDVTTSGELIAQAVLNRTLGTIENAVCETVRNTPVTLEHQHTHVMTLGLVKFAEKKTRNLLTLVSTGLSVLLLWIGAALFLYFQSDTYWGEQYYEIVCSQYTTEAERDILWEDIYARSVLPKEFMSNPSYVKFRIRQNKKILNQRRRKGKDKNGNFSTPVPLER